MKGESVKQYGEKYSRLAFLNTYSFLISAWKTRVKNKF